MGEARAGTETVKDFAKGASNARERAMALPPPLDGAEVDLTGGGCAAIESDVSLPWRWWPDSSTRTTDDVSKSSEDASTAKKMIATREANVVKKAQINESKQKYKIYWRLTGLRDAELKSVRQRHQPTPSEKQVSEVTLMSSFPGEGPDGFIRTVEVPLEGTEWDEVNSELEFSSDDGGKDEEISRTTPFFQTEQPAGWDLAHARTEASAPRPFQTSVDDKIRAAHRDLPEGSPPVIDAGTRDVFRKRKRGIKVSGVEEEGINHNESIVLDDGAERAKMMRMTVNSRAALSDNEEGALAEKQKGKKKKRKEKQAAKKTFADLHLSRPLLKAVEQLEWSSPTPIQTRAIPYILAGLDVCGSAVTGSGKTGAFVLPILERLLQAGVDNATRIVILLPTRELAAQCHSVIISLSKYTAVRAALAVGGLPNKTQEVALRTRPHILVATPGRLIDHLRNAHSFSLDDIEVLIMDEADRLLEMGFQAEVEEIVRNTRSAGRQTLLFSATMTSGLQGLIKLSLQNPINLAVDPVYDVAATLTQEFVKLKTAFESSKDAVLLSLVTRTFKTRAIIFFRQKITAHRFKIIFGLTKLKAAELHGNLTQAQRLAALDSFRDGSVHFLLCTDLAARGLDIAGVETVINYDMPTELKEYVHRVGRTARAGNAGRACSIICSGNNEERKLLKGVAKRAQGKLSARIVPPAVIGKWRAWIDSLEKAVKGVLKEEKHEREMRMAEMELNKANNVLKHSEEIYARPARTWFQSVGEKLDEKAKARREQGLSLGAKERRPQLRTTEKQTRQREIEERKKEYLKQRVEAKKAKRRPSKR